MVEIKGNGDGDIVTIDYAENIAHIAVAHTAPRVASLCERD